MQLDCILWLLHNNNSKLQTICDWVREEFLLRCLLVFVKKRSYWEMEDNFVCVLCLRSLRRRSPAASLNPRVWTWWKLRILYRTEVDKVLFIWKIRFMTVYVQSLNSWQKSLETPSRKKKQTINYFLEPEMKF